MLRCVIVLCLCVLVQCQEQDVGDPCRTSNDQEGVCKLFRDCPGVSGSMRLPNRPSLCGFQRKNPIVCCEATTQRIEESKGEKSKSYCSQLSNPERSEPELPGETDARPTEFPHMAAVGHDNKIQISWGCSGSLISNKHILTAAHCVSTRDFGNVSFVNLGDLDLGSNDEGPKPQEFNIKRAIKHPDYKPPSAYNDIAILELDRPVRITPYVKPACLYVEKELEAKRIIATGWIGTQYGGTTSNKLQKENLQVLNNSKCNDMYKRQTNTAVLRNGIVDDMQICTVNNNPNTCQDYSGGPLQIRHPRYNHKFAIVGISSFGKTCEITENPRIFTRVSNYIEWIESIVWPN